MLVRLAEAWDSMHWQTDMYYVAHNSKAVKRLLLELTCRGWDSVRIAHLELHGFTTCPCSLSDVHSCADEPLESELASRVSELHDANAEEATRLSISLVRAVLSIALMMTSTHCCCTSTLFIERSSRSVPAYRKQIVCHFSLIKANGMPDT